MRQIDWYGKQAGIISLSELQTGFTSGIDVLMIPSQLQQGIYCSESMRWMGTIACLDRPLDLLRSDDDRNEVLRSERKLLEMGYSFSVIPLTEDNFPEFEALYQKEVASREHFIGVNLFDQTMSKVIAGFQTVLIGAYLQNQLMGALVGYIKRNNFSVTVGAKERIRGVKGGLGGVLEMKLLEYCHEKGLQAINHGTSVNPVGLATKPGLFEFKARYGYSAYPEGRWQTLLWLKEQEDTHVYMTMREGKLGYLVVSPDSVENGSELYRTNEVSHVWNTTWAQVVDETRSL